MSKKQIQTQSEDNSSDIVPISSLKSELLKQRLGVHFLLKELVNREIVIVDYNPADNIMWGQIDGENVSIAVGSKIVQKKLMALSKVFKQGKKVKAKVIEKKSKSGNTYIDLE